MEKAPDAFRTISEVAEDLDLPQHVLRFWETRFNQIKPLKRGGGRRYYRPDDIDLLKGIRYYLYGEGYTIKGVQRILKERGVKHAIEMGRAVTENYAPPVAVIPKADEMQRRRARADDWPEAEPLRPRLDTAFDARDLDQPDDFAGLEYSDGDVDELEPPPVEIPAPSHDAPQQPLPAALSPTPNLTRDDLRRLQSTLFELMECKRILDSVR